MTKSKISDWMNMDTDRKPPDTKLMVLAEFMGRLTPSGVVLFIVLGIFGVAAYLVWDQRITIFPQVLASPTALVIIGVSLALTMVLLLLASMFNQLKQSMQGQIDELKAHTARLALEIKQCHEERYQLMSLVVAHRIAAAPHPPPP